MAEKLLERLRVFETPAGERLLGTVEQRARRASLEHRKKLADELEAAKRERDEEMERWHERIEQARQAYADAKRRETEAAFRLRRATGAALSQRVQFESRVSRLEAELRRNLPEEYQRAVDAILFWQNELSAMKLKGPTDDKDLAAQWAIRDRQQRYELAAEGLKKLQALELSASDDLRAAIHDALVHAAVPQEIRERAMAGKVWSHPRPNNTSYSLT